VGQRSIFESDGGTRQVVDQRIPNPQVPGSSPGRGANLHWLAAIALTNVGYIAVRRSLSLQRLLRQIFTRVSVHSRGALGAANEGVAKWRKTCGTDPEKLTMRSREAIVQIRRWNVVFYEAVHARFVDRAV
jgi:hypothetical protein